MERLPRLTRAESDVLDARWRRTLRRRDRRHRRSCVPGDRCYAHRDLVTPTELAAHNDRQFGVYR